MTAPSGLITRTWILPTPAPLANPVLAMAFDSAKPKHWEDSDAWRLSVSYDLKNDFILMAGFAIRREPGAGIDARASNCPTRTP